MEGILGQCECKGNVYVQAGVYVCALCDAEVELHCGACGRECKLRNRAFPKFCSGCRAPFRARITKIKCSNCGEYTELGDGDLYCPDCGEPLPVPHLWRSASDSSLSFTIIDSQSRRLSESSSSSLEPNPGQGSVSANVTGSSASVAVPAQNVPSSSGVDRESAAASAGATGYDSQRTDSLQESSHANSSGNTSFEVIHRSQSFPGSSHAAADVRTMHESLSLALVHEESVGNRDPDLANAVVVQAERVPATSAACQETVPHKDLDIVPAADSSANSQDHASLLAKESAVSVADDQSIQPGIHSNPEGSLSAVPQESEEADTLRLSSEVAPSQEVLGPLREMAVERPDSASPAASHQIADSAALVISTSSTELRPSQEEVGTSIEMAVQKSGILASAANALVADGEGPSRSTPDAITYCDGDYPGVDSGVRITAREVRERMLSFVEIMVSTCDNESYGPFSSSAPSTVGREESPAMSPGRPPASMMASGDAPTSAGSAENSAADSQHIADSAILLSPDRSSDSCGQNDASDSDQERYEDASDMVASDGGTSVDSPVLGSAAAAAEEAGRDLRQLKQVEVESERTGKQDAIHDSRGASDGEFLEVVFYVCISPSILFDSSNGDVLHLVIPDGQHAQWYPMSETRLYSQHPIWACNFYLPNRFFSQQETPFCYRYAIYRPTTKSILHEHLYLQKDPHAWRELYLSKLNIPKQGEGPVYRQFDIMFTEYSKETYEQPQGLLSILKKPFSNSSAVHLPTLQAKILADAKFCLECFLPDLHYCLVDQRLFADDIFGYFTTVLTCPLISDLYGDVPHQHGNDELFEVLLEYLSKMEARHINLASASVPADLQLGAVDTTLVRILSGMTVLRFIVYCSPPDAETRSTRILPTLGVAATELASISASLNSQLPNRRLWTSVLDSAMLAAAQAGQNAWLRALPLYYALMDREPSLSTRYEHGQNEDAWWGLCTPSLKKMTHALKERSAHSNVNVVLWHAQLQDVLKGNLYAGRVFLATLSKEQLLDAMLKQLDLPLDAYAASVLLHSIQTAAPFSYEQMTKAVMGLLSLVEKLPLLSTDKYVRPGDLLGHQLDTVCQVVFHLATATFQDVPFQNWSYVAAVVRLMVTLQPVWCAVESLEAHVENAHGSVAFNNRHQDIANLFDDIMHVATDWLDTPMAIFEADGLCKVANASELEMWEAFFSLNWKTEDLNHLWKKKLSTALRSRVEKVPNRGKLDIYCFYAPTETHIDSIFKKAALRDVAAVIQAPPPLERYSTPGCVKKLGYIINAAFLDAAPESTDSEGFLRLMLTWKAFDLIAKISFGPFKSVLPEEMVLKVKKCVDVVQRVCISLHDGSVRYSELEFLLRNQTRFFELYRLLQDNADRTMGIEECFVRRCDEKNSFESTRTGLKIFIGLCAHLKNVQSMDVASRLESISMEEKISKFWKPQNYRDTFKFECTCFPITRNLLTFDILDKMRSVHKSLLFVAYFEDEGKAGAEKLDYSGSLSMEKVVKDIWPSAYKKFDEFRKRLELGTANFGDGDYFLFIVKSSSNIKAEVETMFDDKNKATQIVERLEMYSKLHGYKKGAKVMLQLKEKFCLTGKFSDLDIFLHFDENRQRNLSDVTQRLIDAGNQLKALEEEKRVQCLEAFLQCRDLVEWVKDTVKDQRELKVFVDLATIVAGENTRDLVRAASFRESVTGYWQLINNLPASAGLTEFLDQCKVLWTSLADDQHLARKLVETNNALSWLKNVKASLGSLEQTSLQQATLINETGVYTVGWRDSNAAAVHDLTFTETVCATVGREADCKTYTYDDLCELQNKLMLVAGQAQQDTKEVDRFVSTFRSVHHLAAAFIKIHAAGTIWFDNFTATVQHDREKPVSIAISVGIPSVTLQDTCAATDCASVVSEIADVLARCSDAWTGLVLELRDKFKLLNYFTIKQIAFLRGQLGAFRNSRTCDEKVFPLLAMLRCCSRSDLLSAMDEAVARVHRSADTEQSSAGTENIEILKERTTSLPARLRSHWDGFLEVTRHRKDNREQFLSLEFLGCFLESLFTANASNLSMRMQEPASLPRSRPHLVVCPKREIFPCALSLYVDQPDVPLPTRNSFLVCNDNTTVEEVTLFLERAFHDDKLLYCVIHAEKLNYEICDYIERRIDSDFKSGSSLVFMCAEEAEDRSRLVTALQRYRSKAFNAASVTKISDYVYKQFRRLCDANGAAAMLNEQCLVRAVTSNRAGLGKTLYIRRMAERLLKNDKDCAQPPLLTIQLSQQNVDPDKLIERLLNSSRESNKVGRRIVHINVFQEAQNGVNEFLFNLLILGSLCSKDGFVYQRTSSDYYMVEFVSTKGKAENSPWHTSFPVIEMLPTLECISPLKCCQPLPDTRPSTTPTSCGMDNDEFASDTWQLPCQYLLALEKKSFDQLKERIGTKDEMLRTLLRHCGIKDPSWSELHHFVLFLHYQLVSFEQSAYCNSGVADDLPDFRNFVLNFLLQMSKDFATRSLSISEESPEAYNLHDADDEYLKAMVIKRRWESSSHPYLFFNPDRTTLTFLGFCVERRTGNIVVPGSRKIIQENVMSKELFDALERNKVSDLSEDFDSKPRKDKLKKICDIMGIRKDFDKDTYDPDPKYELTMDNVKKMLAIHMRFRCGIPVIIMGETGCGKTKLVTYMCKLQVPYGKDLQNLVLMKIHGGVTSSHVKNKVKEAYSIASRNKQLTSKDPELSNIDTVLFLDEANTTDAIGLIKEVLCDDSLDGDPLRLQDVGLRIVAAVNPYRKHSAEMIKRLASAGLGYHVDASKTSDVLGCIPMRHLVYRVRPLPHSLLPLVWDFGQLNAVDEQKYIVQMVAKHLHETPTAVSSDDKLCKAIAKVLSRCQEFMRTQKEECSFVSLRDVDRTLRVMMWFYSMRDMLSSPNSEETDDVDRIEATAAASSRSTVGLPEVDDMTRSLILALGVCYHAGLQSRTRPYFKHFVSSAFVEPLKLPSGEKHMSYEIERCQDLFTKNILKLADRNISLNNALKENIFMMVVCIELRIPLFLVGKPGSSKSLAKSIAAEAMQGLNSQSPLFKRLKQAQLMSFQCSPLATAEGIVKTFKHCASLQRASNLDTFVAVVVLDEIGLAEDSERMPLKTLHPLLEDGCEGDEKPENYMKCGFIGISNWALDPAKMNRGILVQRGVPGKKELADTARGICQFTKIGYQSLNPTIDSLLSAYLKLFQEKDVEKEFFGLRDFYSLMKMLAYFANENKNLPTREEFRLAVLRNFGGLERHIAFKIFADQLGPHIDYSPMDPIKLIESALKGTLTKDGGESRYLLVIAENFTALNLVQSRLQEQGRKAEIIFGSRFSKDLDYIQVCRNINRVKVCMEAGKTVVLLNLESLYESLYDALNQYYVTLGNYRYVDLGLGTHRVKCNVHRDFRLIIIANKKDVLDRSKYPTPLINRLEKHYVDMSSLLTTSQQEAVQKVEDWARQFAGLLKYNPVASESGMNGGGRTVCSTLCDIFVGYSDDAVASIVMQVSTDRSESHNGNVSHGLFDKAKYRLLWSATPDAVLRAKNFLSDEDYTELHTNYFQRQQHTCLTEFLLMRLRKPGDSDFCFQVTTHYKLLSHADANTVKSELTEFVDSENFEVIDALQAVETEQHFTNKIRHFFASGNKKALPDRQQGKPASILLVQCDVAHSYTELIACARHIVNRERQEVVNAASKPSVPWKYYVIFLLQVNRGTSMSGLHGGLWRCVHIDDLRRPNSSLPQLHSSESHSIGGLLDSALRNDSASAKFDIFELMRCCLFEAASRLQDDNGRNEQRLRLLNRLFNSEDGDLEFQRKFAELLVLLLLRLEKSTTTGLMSWLSKDAALLSNVQRHCTFRRSFEACLENRIVPAFAVILSYIDSNCNLELVKSQDASIGQLWKSAFGDKQNQHDLCNRIASAVGDLVNASGKHKVPVINRGITGRFFKSRLPFSWLLKEQLDDAFSRESEKGESPTFGCFVLHVKSQDRPLPDQETIANCYLYDLVSMSYRWHTETDLEVASASLMAAREYERLNSSPLSIEGVHRCFLDLRKRFECLSNVMEFLSPDLKKDVLKDLAEVKESISHKGKSGMIVHLTSLRLLLDHIGKLVQSPVEKHWRDIILKSHSTIEDVLLCSFKPEEDEEISALTSLCRVTWRKLVAARLFFDYVVTAVSHEVEISSSDVIFDHTDIDSLVKRLACTDLNTLDGIKVLEEFLETCRYKLLKRIYGSDMRSGTCPGCKTKLENPVILQCYHVLCHSCFEGRSSCPMQKCKTKADETRKSSSSEQKNMRTYYFFTECLTLFHQRVLSDVVLTGSTLDDELLEHLSTAACRKLSPVSPKLLPLLDHRLRPSSKTFQVYLLQQLLLHPRENNGLKILSSALKEELKLHEFSLPLLFIDCYEDAMRLEHNCALGTLVSSEARNFVDSTFKGSSASAFSKEAAPDPDRLRLIASVRLSIIISAEFICKDRAAISIKGKPYDAIFDICNRVERVRLFLSKYIARKHGVSTLYLLLKDPALRFVMPTDIRKERDELTFIDPFYDGRAEYHSCRAAVTECLQTGKSDSLETWLSLSKDELSRKTVIFQAACSSVAMNHLKPNGLSTKNIDIVLKIIKKNWPDAKDLSERVLQGGVPGKLDLRRVSPILETMLTLFVYRLWILLLTYIKEENLLSPFCSMLFHPESIHESVFPALSSDSLESWTSSCVCPHGHIRGPRTTVVFSRDARVCCSACEAENPELNTDGVPCRSSRKCGYTLNERGCNQMPLSPNNDVKPVTLVVTRLLLHATLCASAAQNGVASWREHPPLPDAGIDMTDDVGLVNFFWTRLYQSDLHLLQSLMDRSAEECLIFLHCIVAKLEALKGSKTKHVREWKWCNVENCDEWERNFQRTIVLPSVQDYEELVTESRRAMLSDGQPANSPCHLAGLVEDAADEQATDLKHLYCHPSVWRYREIPSIRQFKSKFESFLFSCKDEREVQHYAALEIIFRHTEKVAAIRYLPEIVKLAAILQRTYGGYFSPDLLRNLTIEQFYDKYLDTQPTNMVPTIDAFISAWNTVRSELPLHSFWCGGSLQSLDQRISNEDMSWKSPACMVFLSDTQQWFYPLALVTYLAKLHNMLLGAFASDYSEKLENEVDLLDASESHLIAIDPEKDLLPIVLANRRFKSKTASESQRLEYDFNATQLHVIDRFLRHKRPLCFSSCVVGDRTCIPPFQFHQRRTTGSEIEKLATVIPQERLPARLKDELRRVYKSDIAELSDSLVLLDRVVAFLASASKQDDCLLSSYVQDKLQIKNLALPSAVGEKCMLRQIKDLWLLLSFERDRIFVTQNTEVRPNELKICYCDSLPSTDSKDNLKRALKLVNQKRSLAYLLELLYEFILIELSGDKDSAPSANKALWPALRKYEKKNPPDPDCQGAQGLSFDCLEKECEAELYLQHALSVWHEAVACFRNFNAQTGYSLNH